MQRLLVMKKKRRRRRPRRSRKAQLQVVLCADRVRAIHVVQSAFNSDVMRHATLMMRTIVRDD